MCSLRRLFLSFFVLGLVSAVAPIAGWCANNPVPLISSLAPTAIAPGSAAFTLTVEGGNFTASSVVNWNGSARATTFVDAGEITAAIAAADVASQGTATITVTNPAPGGGVSNQQFFSIVAPASRIAFSTNNVTNQVAITTNVVEGDFNNDGKLDLAVALGNVVYVLLGNGDGTFQPAIGTADPSGAAFQEIHAADVNNNGTLDIFAIGASGSGANEVIATFFGNGDGTFQAPVETNFTGGQYSSPQNCPPGCPLVLYPHYVFADFNQDGVLDVAFAGGSQVTVLYGNGDGSFSPGSVTTINSQYDIVRALAAADFTGQGTLSLVVQLNDPSSESFEFVGIITSTNGVFNATPIALTATGSTVTQGLNVIVADFNGDGFPDIATLVTGIELGALSSINVSLNTGNTTTPTFGSPYTIPASTAITQGSLHTMVTGDFNGDGIPDLAADGLVFFGKGDGTFPTSYGTVSLDFLLAGDFNNDGRPDIIRIDPLSGTDPALGILLQIPPAPDFSGSVSPSTVNASLNNTSNVTVNLQALFGWSSDVALSVSGLPAGVTATFTPSTVTGGNGSSNLALSVGASVALGAYPITITGSGGGVTHSSSISLLINSSPGDFTGSITPDTQNIVPGSSTAFSISLSPTGGFTGNVALTLSGALPSGSTYSFSPATIAGGSGSSTLTVNTPTGLSANIYYLTITLTSGIITKSHTVALGVNPSGGDFTGTFTGSLTSAPTGLVEYVFSLQSIGGYNQPVQISFAGLPAGATSDAPISVTPGSAGGVHVTLTNVAPGTYPLLVTLAGPGVVHEVTVSLVVTSQ
jgi:hypothetical protein